MALEPVPHLGQPHALQWALVSTVALLLAPGGTSVEKGEEMCGFGVAPATRPLQCPAGLEGVDATFCCGTCKSPRCCSSREERLDQEKCLTGAQPKEDGRPVRAVLNTEPWPEVGPYWMEFLPYLYAVVGAIFFSILGCWCFCRFQNEEIRMDPSYLLGESCVGGPPTPPGVSSMSVSKEDVHAPLAAPPALEDTGAVQPGSAAHGEEALVARLDPLGDTNGCRTSLRSSMDGGRSKEIAGDEANPGQLRDDSELPGPCVEGLGMEWLEPQMGGDVEEQLKPAADGADLEYLEAGLGEEDEETYLNPCF